MKVQITFFQRREKRRGGKEENLDEKNMEAEEKGKRMKEKKGRLCSRDGGLFVSRFEYCPPSLTTTCTCWSIQPLSRYYTYAKVLWFVLLKS